MVGCLLIAVLSLRGAAVAQGEEEAVNPYTDAPCSLFDDYYDSFPLTSENFDDWKNLYHETVAKVVEEYLQGLDKSIRCSEPTYEKAYEPGTELKNLAQKLPTWKDDPSTLKRTDIGLVLLEYLRSYECPLQERYHFLSLESAELLEKKAGSSAGNTYPEVGFEMSRESQIILAELTTARTTLMRTLSVVDGINRLFPLSAEMECLEKSSLDIRNAAALSAETSACFPRVWNAKDPLRDASE